MACLEEGLWPEPTLAIWWEPTLSAMNACRDLARCRGIADKVGSHRAVRNSQKSIHRGTTPRWIEVSL
jgi:hypothetical protein